MKDRFRQELKKEDFVIISDQLGRQDIGIVLGSYQDGKIAVFEFSDIPWQLPKQVGKKPSWRLVKISRGEVIILLGWVFPLATPTKVDEFLNESVALAQKKEFRYLP